MTTGAEVVRDGVVRKGDVDDKCDMGDPNEVAAVADRNVGGGGGGNVGGNGKDDSDESSYVFVSEGSEASADDTGGVTVGVIAPKSDSVAVVEKVEAEELGMEKGAAPVGSSVVETEGSVHGSATFGNLEPESVKEELDPKNGWMVDTSVVLEANDVLQESPDSQLGEPTGEQGAIATRTIEVKEHDVMENIEAQTHDVDSGVRVDSQATLNPMENAQVTVFEPEDTSTTPENSESQGTITQSGSTPDLINAVGESLTALNPVRITDSGVKVDSEITPNPMESAQVTVFESADGSKTTENSESQVTITQSGSTVNLINTDDESLFTLNPVKNTNSGVEVDSESTPNPMESTQVTDCEYDASKTTEDSESQVTITQPGSTLELINTVGVSLSTPNPIMNTDVGVKVDSESTPNAMESAHVTVFESDDGSETTENSESQVTITQSGSTPDSINTVGESRYTPTPGRITDSGLKVVSESTLNSLESAQVTVFEPDDTSKATENSESQVTITQSGSSPDLINTVEESLSTTNPVWIKDSDITVNDGSGSISNLTDKAECQETVDESDSTGKPMEDAESQVTADESESSGLPLEKQECQVSVDESEDIGDSVDNQKCQVSVDGTESTGNTESKVTDMESAGKSEECQEFNGEAEPDHVSDGIKVGHQNESVSTPYPFENKSAEGTDIGLGTESEEKSGSVVMSSEVADAPANAEDEKLGGIVELGEIQMSQTEVEKAKPEEQVENQAEGSLEEQVEYQVEGSSESLVKNTASVKLEAELEETKKEQVDVSVHHALNLKGDAAVHSANEAEEPLETEAIFEPIIEENAAPKHKEASRCDDKTQTGFQLKESAENVETLLSTGSVKSESKNEEVLVEKDRGLLPTGDDVTSVALQGECGTNLDTENRSAEDMDCKTKIENLDASDDEVKDAPLRLSFPDTYVSTGTVIEFGSIGHHEKVPGIHHDETKPARDMDDFQSDGIPTSSIEGSTSDTIDGQNEEAEIPPYNFLIRIPRYEDEMLRDQIRKAQLQVDEKTRIRDAIRTEIHGRRARLRAYNDEFNAAKLEETAARRLVRLKRQEIDSVQVIINRVKNAISVEDIDGRIHAMERMIQHETLSLKDEKQFIREIKQLKNLRDQLASNMGSPDEVQQALDQKDEVEERLKVLRRELDSLKDKVSKAEASAIAVGKKYDHESKRERELHAQFRAADEVRQQAYAHLNSLKRQSYEKNKTFRMYKEDVMAARDFAARGDKDALHRLCAKQVETFMEQWNGNDEFRQEYVNRCSMNASRRQRTVDERSAGVDEAALVPPDNTIEKVDRSLVSVPVPVSVAPNIEKATMASPVEERADTKPTENVSEEKKPAVKTQNLAKPTLGSDSATVTQRVEEAVDTHKEETEKPTMEEMELARKAEELRQQEIAAKLKEQRRLEEKAKAIEALERKKRNAEKAQMRAELRARKEAEQKEKEREKRLRKKEKKRTGGDGSANGDDSAANSESSNEAPAKDVVESVKDKDHGVPSAARKKAQKPPPHFYSNSKQLKPKPSPPPPFANRNKKRWQNWARFLIVAVFVAALFFIGNSSFFINFRIFKSYDTA